MREAKKAKYRDGMHYFLGLLIPKPFEMRKRKQLENTGYISLNAIKLKEIIGPEYNDIIKWLEIPGIIRVNPRYLPGVRNRGYRIVSDYFTETTRVQVTNRGICQRYWVIKAKYESTQVARLNKIPYLTKWLDKDFISIDINGAHRFMESYRRYMLKHLEAYQFSDPGKKKEARCRIANRFFYQSYVIQLIKNGDVEATRDRAGRLYSPFVHLKKELRSFVRLNGAKIGSIDVKASQPFLFLKLLDEKFWKTGSSGITLYNIYKERYHEVNDGGNRHNTIMLLNNLQLQYGSGLQEMPFKKIVWNEDFYDQVRLLIGTPTDLSVLKYFTNRSSVKKTMMLLLYDQYQAKTTPYYAEFQKYFPDETSVMDVIKLNQSKSLFPTILQAVEAKIILEDSCKQISGIFPELPILTIHDSVVCDIGYIDRVKNILENSLMQNIGIKPGLKVEQLDKELVLQNIQQTVDKDWAVLVNDLSKMDNNPDWVASFNEEPKEIPLKSTLIKIDGLLHLEKRMAYPIYEDDYEDFDEEIEDAWDDREFIDDFEGRE